MSAAENLNTNRPALITDGDLARDYEHVVKGVSDLALEAGKLPVVIEDEEDMSAVAALVPRLRAAHKRINDLREGEKAPFLSAGRTVDGWFNKHLADIQSLGAALNGRLNSYQTKKAAAERKRLEDEEQAKRQEAERLRLLQKEADNTTVQAAASEAAAEAENEAAEAAKAATAKAAELVRTHTEAGNTVSAQEVWSHKVTDFSKIDHAKIWPYLAPGDVDAAIARAVKAGLRECAGIAIEKSLKTIVR